MSILRNRAIVTVTVPGSLCASASVGESPPSGLAEGDSVFLTLMAVTYTAYYPIKKV